MHQSIEFPLFDTPRHHGTEYFAKWTPSFDLDSQFITDANGFDLITREVWKVDSGAFSSSFYPVDASITVNDSEKKIAMTIWNDRPQAGSVHNDDKSIKLLIDRRLKSKD